MIRTAAALSIVLSLAAGAAHAQSPARQTGPVIQSAGEVFAVPSPDVPAPTDRTYRAVFEVVDTPDSHERINLSFNTAARFLNMHVRAGVPLEQLHLALVVHGPAGKDLLTDEAYRERYGTANPNTRVIEELADAGVRIILCGQTAAARDLPREVLAPPVEVALSAMTALVLLQDEGYRLIPF